MTIDQALRSAADEFRSQNVSSSPRLDAELLLGSVLKKSKTELMLERSKELTTTEMTAFLALVERRKTLESIAYILGEREFYKSTFQVGPGVLVPRPETELIVEDVAEFSKARLVKKILDLGVGSGCLGLSCLVDNSEATLVGVEISEAALGFAKKNAKALGLESRVQWIHGDVDVVRSTLPAGDFDVVVSNPPYIGRDEEIDPGVKKFEPHGALFSENRGLEHLQSWAKVAIQCLKPGGLMVFEIGAGQGAEILSFFEKTRAFEDLRIKQDLAGLDRRVWGLRAQINKG